MGRVSIRAQWLIIATGVLLYSIFVLLMPCLIGWWPFRRLWWRPEAGSGSAHAPIGGCHSSAGVMLARTERIEFPTSPYPIRPEKTLRREPYVHSCP
jgi:hypothetical protein